MLKYSIIPNAKSNQMKSPKKKKIVKSSNPKNIFLKFFHSMFWFFIGALLALFFLVSFAYIFFKIEYRNKIYPGVIVNNVNFGGKSEKDVKDYFEKKNKEIQNTKFVFTYEDQVATVSARDINFGYDSNLLATQAISLGRSGSTLSDMSLLFQAYLNGVYLKPSYSFFSEKLKVILFPLTSSINKDPINALFQFENGRVSTFRISENGQQVDLEELNENLIQKAPSVVSLGKAKILSIPLPIKILKPEVTTEKANNMGVKELIGTGTSLYQGSIEGRIFNVGLATTRINGVLIKPNEIFSFNKALGDVSAFTGYKQAYIIQNGRTVLGDGGGVCQVSTTLFRAALEAGLPIVERWPHAYRVHYYEEDSGPGIDATVYSPSNDLKFKNDTGNYILIQAENDPTTLRLAFYLYGTKDGRTSTIGTPVVLSQTPPPPTLYQDDPTLPKGVLKQVDFAAWGANVYFTRQVTKNGKVIISDKFVSNYKPWQEIYLKGTKE
jgi:vancomycin resistance protein YoaR